MSQEAPWCFPQPPGRTEQGQWLEVQRGCRAVRGTGAVPESVAGSLRPLRQVISGPWFPLHSEGRAVIALPISRAQVHFSLLASTCPSLPKTSTSGRCPLFPYHAVVFSVVHALTFYHTPLLLSVTPFLCHETVNPMRSGTGLYSGLCFQHLSSA